MNARRAAIAAAAIAVAGVVAGSVPAAAGTGHGNSRGAGPDSIIGDSGKLALTSATTQARGTVTIVRASPARPAAGPSCSWKERHVINLGNAGNIQVYLNTQSGCIWWARVTCETNGGTSTVVHDSSQADGETNRTAGCDNGTHPIHGGWRGAWNNVLHLDF